MLMLLLLPLLLLLLLRLRLRLLLIITSPTEANTSIIITTAPEVNVADQVHLFVPDPILTTSVSTALLLPPPVVLLSATRRFQGTGVGIYFVACLSNYAAKPSWARWR